MKNRSIIIALAIVLTPFVLGMFLFIAQANPTIPGEKHFISDIGANNKAVNYKGIGIDWAFCPDWKYKPLLFHAQEYFVFVFQFRNNNKYAAQLMPSYYFASPPGKIYSANEEISMYIENNVERELKLNDETPITYKISPNSAKNHIVTFETAENSDQFYVDVDIFRDAILRIHYEKTDGSWVNHKNEFINKYKGRG